MEKASTGQTWAQIPHPLHEEDLTLMFMAHCSQGIPFGGFLKTLK
jgi:hypothetical protein